MDMDYVAQAKANLDEADEMLKLGKPKFALISVRQALELCVRKLCSDASIELNDENGIVPLISLIDKLKDNIVLSEDEASLFHKIRMLANKGAHTDDTPTYEDAKEAIELSKRALEIIERQRGSKDIIMAQNNNNIPMSDPDFYDAQKRCFGKWPKYQVMDTALLTIPEYVSLYRRAENEDITAMIEIAQGFVPKYFCVENQLVQVKSKVKNENGKTIETCEIVYGYYYWILKAASAIVKKAESDVFYPKKYAAAVLYDALVAITSPDFKGYTYEMKFTLYVKHLLLLLEEYGVKIIPPVHQETTETLSTLSLVPATYDYIVNYDVTIDFEYTPEFIQLNNASVRCNKLLIGSITRYLYSIKKQKGLLSKAEKEYIENEKKLNDERYAEQKKKEIEGRQYRKKIKENYEWYSHLYSITSSVPIKSIISIVFSIIAMMINLASPLPRMVFFGTFIGLSICQRIFKEKAESYSEQLSKLYKEQ